MSQLWIPESAARKMAEHKKAAPPLTGPAFGRWGGHDPTFMQLPGGGVMQFDLSRLTLGDYRQMRDHYQVNISLALLTFMMHQIDWRIDCGDARIREATEEMLTTVWTRLVRAMGQAYWAGFSPIVIDWENDLAGKRIVPNKFKDLVPETCTVNWKKVDGYAPPGHAKPKRYIYDGIKEQGSSFPIPSSNTLWYALLMENGDHYGRKLLRPAFPAWFFSQLMHLFSNRYFERFGEPLPIGRAPFDDEVDTGKGVISGREAMENILKNIRNRSVVVLPNNTLPTTGAQYRTSYEYEIEYLESQMRGADFERYMTRLDEEISLALFTPLLLVRTADVGSYNLGTAHLQSYLWMHNALAGDFKEYVDHFLLDRFVDINFSPNAPRARWSYKPGGKTDAETIRALITTLVSGGMASVDLEELGTALGLTVSQVRQVTEPGDEPDPDEPDDDDDRPTPIGRRDTRAGRVRADAGSSTSTRRQITARIAQQLDKQFLAGSLGTAKVPVLGYRRQMAEALGNAGVAQADRAADALYARMNSWLAEAASLGADGYRDAAELVERFDTLLAAEVGDLLAA